MFIWLNHWNKNQSKKKPFQEIPEKVFYLFLARD
tara:strand:- start:506 stop:607 length:102 start_codon:yes stop_codon:yes gene_type:complete